MSPQMCREFVMPLVRERAGLFKDYGATVVMHSCGGVYPVIGDIADAGVDILNPIQPRARGMDRRRIKQEFGSRLIFHGSVDQQTALVFGTPEDVRKDTIDCLSTLGKGGGYIVAASHELEADISTANVVALYDTAREFR
jgi:uroporphyrinogen decarboxylase